MGRHILHLRFDLSPDPDAELPERLRRLLEGITPRVQMIEPDMAVLDLTGALPYWKRDARALTEVVQLRALAHFGLPSSAGCAGNRMLAAMACALTPPGRRTVIADSPEAITAFLRPWPVRELPGVGAKTACTPSTTSPTSRSPHCSASSAPAPAEPSMNTPTAATPPSSTHTSPGESQHGAPLRPRRARPGRPPRAFCSPSPTTSVPASAPPVRSPRV
jgi:DNA polymerase-4